MFNENWYSDEQCQNLINLLNKTKYLSGKIIEIGCWEGKSTTNLAKNCYPEILYCNDTWLGNVEESKLTGIVHPTELILKERDVYSIFLNNMNTLTNGNYKVIKHDCNEWLKNYDEPIKFIHIDASHEYESVYKTIQLIIPKMVKGGIICGDDFVSANIHRADLNGGVERAVVESFSNYKNINNLWYWINE
jgi:predicted O-methyltransferase YrrM